MPRKKQAAYRNFTRSYEPQKYVWKEETKGSWTIRSEKLGWISVHPFHDPGFLYVTCHCLQLKEKLKTTEIEAAKVEALEVVREHIADLACEAVLLISKTSGS